jgi:hypothetical protein
MTREEVVNSMSLQDAIQVLKDTNCYGTMDIAKTVILKALDQEPCEDAISRQAAIDALHTWFKDGFDEDKWWNSTHVLAAIEGLPSAQPEQRYTEEELRVFQHGISLSLLSKRSSQHWQYDEDTATEIKFLERLYEKVGADIRSEHDG